MGKKNEEMNIKAKQLRKNLTDAEEKLWTHLRLRQIDGFKFRRQFPIGPYIADFVCLEKRLIIEIDGGQHVQQERYDAQRTQWLERQNFQVIRFWNNTIFEEVETVLQVIGNALTPPPFSSPARGEEPKEDVLLEKPTVSLHNRGRGISQPLLLNGWEKPCSKRKRTGNVPQMNPSPLAEEGKDGGRSPNR